MCVKWSFPHLDRGLILGEASLGNDDFDKEGGGGLLTPVLGVDL